MEKRVTVLFFYLFISSMKCKCHFKVNSLILRGDSCLQMDVSDNPTAQPTLQREGTLCELRERLTVSGHNDPQDRNSALFFPPQSNLQLDPVRGDVFFTSVCFVCRAVVNTSSALFMSRNQPPPPLGLYTVPSAALSAVEDCSSSDVC